ncbi:MAG: hypothetical protein ACOYXT_09800 [Bacteroidota bacterium]
MRKIVQSFFALGLLAGMISCQDNELTSRSGNDETSTTLVDVVQTSGQLASGTSFSIAGSSTDSTGHRPKGNHRHKRHKGILDGVNLLAPTDELLAIVDAESAGDFRGMRISGKGGATITHYNAAGEEVTLPTPANGGPNGCSFSGKQFPAYDSMLSTIVKTIIDFGTGVTYARDTVSITRSGRIITTRHGDDITKTEVTTFENYKVNDILIEGIKTRISTFDSTTGTGTSLTSVSDGKITFADGSLASWSSEKTRTSHITLDDSGKPESGEIVTEVNTEVKASDGTLIFAHHTTKPLTENITCRRRPGPVSGTLETVYHEDTVTVDYGDGSCDNKTITIIINGVMTTRAIGH